MPTAAQYEQSLADMKDWLKLQAKETKGEIKIVSSQDVDMPYMLHIDKNPVKVFTPRIGDSFSEMENRTIPRITVSPTLVGCIEGYARVHYDLMTGHTASKQSDEYDVYRQGYVIHRLDYLHALKPSSEMVFDSARSDEHWLVNYCAKYKEYPSVSIGEFYICSLTFVVPQGKASKGEPNLVISGYLKHSDTDGMIFCEDKKLAAGAYMFTVELTKRNVDKQLTVEPTVIKIKDSEYASNKKLYAALLSDRSPGYLKW